MLSFFGTGYLLFFNPSTAANTHFDYVKLIEYPGTQRAVGREFVHYKVLLCVFCIIKVLEMYFDSHMDCLLKEKGK